MRRMTLLVSALVVAVVLVSAAAGSAGPGQARWVIRDLGVLPGDSESVADDLNDRGQIVARSRSMSGPESALEVFLWDRGRVVHIASRDASDGSEPMINERGMVAGTMLVSRNRHAFLWENGKLSDLGILGVGEQASSWASAINDRGEVVGGSSTRGLGYHPFLWRNGRMIDLGTLGEINAIGLHLKKGFYGGPGGAGSINNRGQVAGSVTWGKSLVYVRAFLWQSGRIRELPAPAGTWTSFTTDMNERGQILGVIEGADPNSRHAVIWHDGRITNLGVRDGAEGIINEQGQVLINQYPGNATVRVTLWKNGHSRGIAPTGASRTLAADINDAGTAIVNTGDEVWNYTTFPYPDGTRAWVWRNGSAVRLPTLSGGTSTWATAINNNNQIVGASTTKDGKWHAVLWTLRSG